MNTSYKNYQNLSANDQAAVDKFIPTWQRHLNTAYEFVFGPFNRLMTWLEVHNTRGLIADFEAHEAAQADKK
jgi:hypothetical protein